MKNDRTTLALTSCLWANGLLSLGASTAEGEELWSPVRDAPLGLSGVADAGR